MQQTAELVAQLLEERNAVANNDTYGVVKQDRDEMPVLIPQVRVPPGLESIPSELSNSQFNTCGGGEEVITYLKK